MTHHAAPNADIVWQQGDKWRLVRRGRQASIDHPGAVVLVPLLGDDVLLISQYRVPLQQTILELPAGTRGWDENWLDCAQRELQEETGYRARRLVSLGKLWPAPGLSNELMHLFLALDLVVDPLPQDEDEQIELIPTPLPQVQSMLQAGVIFDAKTVVGVERTARYLAEFSV